jgi:uncharacterized alkaline shock family protein YloU
MMKWLHRVIGFLIIVLLGWTCVSVLYTAVSGDRVAAFGIELSVGRIMGAGIGVGGLCVLALFLLSGIRPKRRERFLSFDSEGGTVSISTDAIADYVSKLAAEFPSVVRMRPDIIPSRGAISINVDVRVKAGPQIHEVCELMQRRIRESVANGLGISEIKRVVVSVSEVVSEHRPQ